MQTVLSREWILLISLSCYDSTMFLQVGGLARLAVTSICSNLSPISHHTSHITHHTLGQHRPPSPPHQSPVSPLHPRLGASGCSPSNPPNDFLSHLDDETNIPLELLPDTRGGNKIVFPRRFVVYISRPVTAIDKPSFPLKSEIINLVNLG